MGLFNVLGALQALESAEAAGDRFHTTAWALLLIETALRVAGQSLFQTAPKFGSDLYIHGVIALSQGFMLSSMVLAAMLAHVIDRKFLKASAWCGLGAVMSLTGLIHA